MIKVIKRRITRDEIARRGRAIYELIRPKVARERKGRVVAVDIKSGEFAVGDNAIEAATELRSRISKPEIWFERIGFRTLIKIRTRRRIG